MDCGPHLWGRSGRFEGRQLGVEGRQPPPSPVSGVGLRRSARLVATTADEERLGSSRSEFCSEGPNNSIARQSFHGPQQLPYFAPSGNRVCDISPVFKCVFIPLRSARRRSAVHPASAVLHRGRLARALAPCPCSASWCLAHGARAWGCSFAFGANPPPPALDIADDGLAAFVNVNVLREDQRSRPT
jgi:hypothetical protein